VDAHEEAAARQQPRQLVEAREVERAARFRSRKIGGYIAKKLMAPLTSGPRGLS
jgi:hypothetical protein